MKVALLTREYPPEVYGGAGVHVEYLARELQRLADVTVHCWGADRPAEGGPPVVAHRAWERLAGGEPWAAALETVSIDLAMAAAAEGADLVHSHTWYANLGGHLAKLLHGIPHVATVHSLEPMRPWKAEQLGGGYAVSSLCERVGLERRDAVIAVSAEMRRDLLSCYPAIDPARVSVIDNGIDTEEYRPDPGTDVLERLRHRPEPAVGRLRRTGHATEGAHVPARRGGRRSTRTRSSSSAPARRTRRRSRRRSERSVERVRDVRGGVVWVEKMLPKREVIQLLSHATVFVCPSIYEPLGIVNLEAMACEAAVVATATGGIPEVVEDGVTGLLVPFEPGDDRSRAAASTRRAFAADIAERVNELLARPGTRDRAGQEQAGSARSSSSAGRRSPSASPSSTARSLRAPARAS